MAGFTRPLLLDTRRFLTRTVPSASSSRDRLISASGLSTNDEPFPVGNRVESQRYERQGGAGRTGVSVTGRRCLCCCCCCCCCCCRCRWRCVSSDACCPLAWRSDDVIKMVASGRSTLTPCRTVTSSRRSTSESRDFRAWQHKRHIM